jgi:hypothetical protein
MRRRNREASDQAVILVALALILIVMLSSCFRAIIKTDEARDCERWARQYGHDYCSD